MDDVSIRRIHPHEMFFSLTDSRGVITGVNSVFATISQYDRADLIDAPHNIVRSPAMPSGVFRLMWDIIQAGRPFAGYVQSQAADGTRYWVFATITPIHGGYLSVRTSPCVTDAWQAVQRTYSALLSFEERARAEGASRRDVALLGRDALLEDLARQGYTAYEDFMAHLLPLEASERARLAPADASAPAMDDERLGIVRTSAILIGDEASALLQQIQRFRSLSDGLRESARGASEGAHGLTQATAAARAASEVVAESAPSVLSTVRAMEQGGGETLAGLNRLAARLDMDLRLLRGLQIRIALAKLHADMAVSFVDDLDSDETARFGIDYLPDICGALEATIRLLTEALAAHTASMREIVTTIEGISNGLGQFQDFLFMWRSLLIRNGVSSNVASHLAPIDQQLRDGFVQVTALQELARRCLADARPYESGPLLDPLRQLLEALDGIPTGPGAA